MHRRVSRIAAAFAAASLLSLPARAAPLPTGSAEAAGFSLDGLQKLNAAMHQVVDQKQLAGVTTMIVRHGKVVAFDAYGEQNLAAGEPIGRDTIFRIYSQTKPVTGVAMMILYEQGKWRLDDPVTKYVPEFKALKVMTGIDAKGEPILEDMKRPPTMRELMTHTAGFGYGLTGTDPVNKAFRDQKVLASDGLQQMIDKVARIPLLYQSGAEWRYSVAADIQGYIVQKLSGQPLGEFMQQRIFKPLGMKDTGFQVSADKAGRLSAVYAWNPIGQGLVDATARIQDFTKPPPMESGGGGLVSTSDDYARFTQMLLNGGELDGARILSPQTVALMRTNQLPANVLVTSNGTGQSRFGDAIGFGLDFMVIMDPAKAQSPVGKGTYAWGGAAGTWFWIDPSNDIAFIGMIQRFGGVSGTNLPALSQSLTYSALVHPER